MSVLVSKIEGNTTKCSNYTSSFSTNSNSDSGSNPNPNPKTEIIPKTEGASPLVGVRRLALPQTITKTESIL